MKKILLTFALFGAVLFGYSQTVLNEVYTEPGSGKSEFFELYNSSTVGSQNLDCFTLVTYWESGANKGFYVIDLPNLSVASKGFFVGAAANPFNVQAQTGVVPNFSWNDAAFLAANNGFLKSYQVNSGGTGYNAPTTPSNLNDLFYKANIGGVFYVSLLFQNGAFINGFLGGDADGILHTAVQGLPNLFVDMNGPCSDFTINFSTLGKMEFVNQAPGSDNGFARTSDGKCGAWEKTAPGVSHTPKVSNGSAAGLAGSLTTAELVKCALPQNYVVFNVTGISGDVTLADDFPVIVHVYLDSGKVGSPGYGQLSGNDLFVGTKPISAVNGAPDSIYFTETAAPFYRDVIIVYQTKRGCFDKVVWRSNGCVPTLPVKFSLFTAKRTSATSVNLVWQTSSELNNSGFEVQRNISGSWETVIFIPTQAPGGNSDIQLNYSYTDMNSAKGITQYRIRQVDLDGKAEFSVYRAVRGEGVSVKTIIYPNPSFDGKVNVVFEDASGIRDIVLVDMNGRMIRNWKGVSNNNLLIDNLNTGFYSLRVTVRETGVQTVEKIVINKR